jgi:hypothetical protein
MANRGLRRQKSEEFQVVDTEAGKQEVKRSGLGDREIWRQECERFSLFAKKAAEQEEVMRLRLADKEIQRQRGERLCVADLKAGG